MPNVLSDLKIHETSLVDRPANSHTDPTTGKRTPRATVALWKADTSIPGSDQPGVRKGEPMDLNELIKKQEAQDGLLATMKKDQDALAAKNAELSVLAKMSDKEKAAFGSMSKAKQKEYMDASDDQKKEMMSAACKGADEPDADDAKKLDPALKAFEARLEKVAKEASDNIAASNARVTKAEAEVADIRKRERLSYFTKKAEDELPYTSGAPIEKGQMLVDLADAFGGETDQRFVKSFGAMKAADAALSLQFKSQGVYGGGSVRKAGTELEAAVKAIAKRDNITEGQAWIKASDEHADLWKRADEEKRTLSATR